MGRISGGCTHTSSRCRTAEWTWFVAVTRMYHIPHLATELVQATEDLDFEPGFNLERFGQPNIKPKFCCAIDCLVKSRLHWPGQTDTGEWLGVSTAMVVAVYIY